MKPDIHTITSIILDEGYFAALPTIGPSMYPTLRSGDKIYVESLKGDRPEIGDIILFKSPSPLPLPSGERIKVRGESPHRGEEVISESSPYGGSESVMICHRLIQIFERNGTTYYQTRGDAFFHKDRPITYYEIIGRVVKIERSEISWPRRLLLLLNPFLGRFPLLNAAIINGLMWIKTIVRKTIK